ncbi:MAG: DUF3810 domain-containing protein [Ruminococcus sp.]|nr:DUF3810 domain-containing protein [Ruminococcus sp.]
MKKQFFIPLIITALSLILTVAGRLFKNFADFYADNIFPIISTPYVFISGLITVSLGELMIITAILILIIGIPAMIICLIIRKTRAKTIKVSMLASLWILAFIVCTESLNCFTLYGCTRFSERFFTPKEHDNDELKQVYSLLIDKCNELAVQVPRDEHNRFVLTIDAADECRKAMKKASGQYPQLKGYYPKPKPIMFSFFMSQTGTAGMYFPFSMESTYNNDMVDEILPEVICHEYAHLKGFMQEDEANFISFIATTGSESAEVQYSGYLEALEYVHNQIYRNEIVSGYGLTDEISQEVKNDWFRFLPENYWEDNQEKEIIPTETVDAVYNTAADTSMKLNGVEDGNASYSRMVNLLLDYYFPPEQ